MTENAILYIAQHAIKLILTIASPMVAVGVSIALTVSVFQSATSIQEQSLSYIPKMFGIMMFLLFSGNRIYNLITTYAFWLFDNIPMIINGTLRF
ncbi:flagellar biosynthetic protein FliQ [bacterium]|nr:flagellar biosynthetic protein FliQ [bacterium]